jgi:GrpB-like predicted nucleotidyltransferase (UPF0157 family)
MNAESRYRSDSDGPQRATELEASQTMAIGKSRNPVELVPFDALWRAVFEEIANQLRISLSNCVLSIDHVGSTAIPNMLAKPFIDIDISVRDLNDIAPATDILLGLGYEPRGSRYDDDMWAFLMRNCPTGQRVYRCPPDNPTHRKRLVFRDYLIAHPNTARQYANLKMRLASAFENDGDAYTAAKGSFIEDVVARAMLPIA